MQLGVGCALKGELPDLHNTVAMDVSKYYLKDLGPNPDSDNEFKKVMLLYDS